MLIDTHVHLMFEDFDADREQVIKRAREAGVGKIVNVGCGIEPSRQSVEMADGEFLYATVGLHPYDALDYSEELMLEWEMLILEERAEAKKKMRQSCIVAIGETGLDYFKAKVDHEKQKLSFVEHIKLAGKVGLPLIVHNRDADEDCYKLLEELNGVGEERMVDVVFHCYGSNLEFAHKVWEAGYFTSFTGIITYPNAGDLREVVKQAPLEQIMIETDCPYLAPQAYRGKRNEPAYVVEVAKCIAEVRGLSLEVVTEQLSQNTYRFFGF